MAFHSQTSFLSGGNYNLYNPHRNDYLNYMSNFKTRIFQIMLFVLSFCCLMTNLGCQRNRQILFENKSNIQIRVYESNFGEFIGVAPPKTRTKLEKLVLMRGSSDIRLTLKQSDGTTLKQLDIPFEKLVLIQDDIYVVYSPDKH